MAIRYCGRAKIRVQLTGDDQYKCVVRDASGACVRMTVRPSPDLQRKHALDSSAAFDSIARSAVSFALDERDVRGATLLAEGDFDLESGFNRMPVCITSRWAIRRKA